MIDRQFVVLTARVAGAQTDVAARPAAAQVEVLELFAAQAGASPHNAQVHQGLEELKDRLDHEASHDSLTGLANRRRFTDELQRVTRGGRPGDLVGVLFCDLDGFTVVNDRHGQADAAMYRSKSGGKARWTMDPRSLESAADANPDT